MRSSHVVLDQVDITFDDPRAVAHAGLLLPVTLAERLGIEQATDELVDLGDRTGAAHPGRKLLTLVHAMVAGGDCIDDLSLSTNREAINRRLATDGSLGAHRGTEHRLCGSSLADCQVGCQPLGLVLFQGDVGERARAVYLERWTATDGVGRAGRVRSSPVTPPPGPASGPQRTKRGPGRAAQQSVGLDKWGSGAG
jgi:hypothetical protein